MQAKRVRADLGLSQSQMSRLLGISPRKLSAMESRPSPPRPETSRRLREIDRLRRALGEIIEPEAIGGWLEEPNEAFEGSTPLQVVERGEIDRIWRMIYAVRSGHPF